MWSEHLAVQSIFAVHLFDSVRYLIRLFAKLNERVLLQELSVKRNMLWNSLGSIFYLGCQWLLSIVVVRFSSDYSSAGVLALAMAIGNIFTPLAGYRMRTMQVSDIKREFCAGQYMAFRIVTVLIALTVCLLYSLLTCQLDTIFAIALFLLYKVVEQAIDVMHGLDQQRMRLDIAGKSMIVRGSLTLVSFAVVFWFSGSLELSFLAMIASTLPVGVFYDLRMSSQFEPLVPQIDFKTVWHLLLMCLPAVLAAVLSSATLTVPRQYLSYAFDSSLLGIYSSVASPVAIVQMGATYLYNPLLGRFSSEYVSGSIGGFKQLLVRVSLWIMAMAAISSVLLFLFGRAVLVLLFGESIAPYSYLIQPTLICSIVTAYSWFLGDILIVVRDFRGNLYGNIISFLASISLTMVLVGQFDMNGVNYVGIVSLGLGSLFLLVRLLNILSRNRSTL